MRPMIDVQGTHAYGVRPDNALNPDVPRKRDRRTCLGIADWFLFY